MSDESTVDGERVDEKTTIDLQMRMMEQEQSIEALSQQLFHQSGLIENLNKSIKILEMKLSQLGEAGSDTVTDEGVQIQEHRPPHY
ncbi:MAG: hypothetical protein GKR95_23705 [Gammaproteobacteria bacterium]|nr:hypothetical protein [Gammaproteobacteria bacterium]NKB64985.1 hypothetical protein [Gammaproteobacteria bacterium]